ncbi:hypothetical protein CERSUDRAFT_116464 [Gelatoporia subvermispora B]|uniref:Uncharacterized protein n=1 Tax=Ceriporiopsis subvermispora (strain B) TaxID=914234 RepID=M2R8E1_CERS8|nr:hypothetical protein CERSUDRAFT_116464 [Gelatoporia subvermispora B]
MSTPDRTAGDFDPALFKAPSDAIFGHARKRSLSKPRSDAEDRPATTPSNPPVQKTVPKARAAPSKPKPIRRPDSPDIETIIAKTPRPRRRSSATFPSPAARLRSRSYSTLASESTKSSTSSGKGKANESLDDVSDYGVLLQESVPEDTEEGDGSESDSSIDVHTPLPHLMFRDGLLSPRSKLLPSGNAPNGPYPFLFNNDDQNDFDRARSALSIVSNATVGSVMTKSGYWKDPRDTERRRIRHKDGHLLRAGMGLTTGLGWSDSEDEDAPSMLTRRLISTSIAKRPVGTTSRTSSQVLRDSVVAGLSRSPVSPRPSVRDVSTKTFSRSPSSSISSLRSGPSPKIGSPVPRIPRARTQSNVTQSTLSTSTSTLSIASVSTVDAGSSTASQSSSTSTGSVPRPLRLPQSAHLRPRLGRSATGTSIHSMIDAGARATPEHQRARTLSNPSALFANTQSTGSPRPVLRHTTQRHTTAQPTTPQGRRLAGAPPSISPNSVPTSPAPSGTRSPTSPTLRARPTVAGPRPKPRTGTGMVYHSSAAYSAGQPETRYRSVSMASTSYGRF